MRPGCSRRGRRAPPACRPPSARRWHRSGRRERHTTPSSERPRQGRRLRAGSSCASPVCIRSGSATKRANPIAIRPNDTGKASVSHHLGVKQARTSKSFRAILVATSSPPFQASTAQTITDRSAMERLTMARAPRGGAAVTRSIWTWPRRRTPRRPTNVARPVLHPTRRSDEDAAMRLPPIPNTVRPMRPHPSASRVVVGVAA